MDRGCICPEGCGSGQPRSMAASWLTTEADGGVADHADAGGIEELGVAVAVPRSAGRRLLPQVDPIVRAAHKQELPQVASGGGKSSRCGQCSAARSPMRRSGIIPVSCCSTLHNCPTCYNALIHVRHELPHVSVVRRNRS